MMGHNIDSKETEAEEEFDDFSETMEIDVESSSADSSNVGEGSVEIDVEELVAELEADMGIQASTESQDSRKRLEDLLEERRAAKELDELDEFALDDV